MKSLRIVCEGPSTRPARTRGRKWERLENKKTENGIELVSPAQVFANEDPLRPRQSKIHLILFHLPIPFPDSFNETSDEATVVVMQDYV